MQIENQFSITRIESIEDFDFPEPRVTVWSNAFEPGGSVNIEAKVGKGRIEFMRMPIKENRRVVDEREEAQAMVDEWLLDNKGNWLNEIERCLVYIAEHEQGQIDEVEERRKELAEHKKKIKAVRKIKTEYGH